MRFSSIIVATCALFMVNEGVFAQTLSQSPPSTSSTSTKTSSSSSSSCDENLHGTYYYYDPYGYYCYSLTVVPNALSTMTQGWNVYSESLCNPESFLYGGGAHLGSSAFVTVGGNLFVGGDTCPNGVDRSTRVQIVEVEGLVEGGGGLVSVTEPTMCEYEALLEVPECTTTTSMPTPTDPSPSASPTETTKPSSSPSTKCPGTDKEFTLFLNPDVYYYETSWSLEDVCTGESILGQSKIDEYPSAIVYCLDSKTKYKFTINDSFGDGMGNDGSYQVSYGDDFIVRGGEFQYEESTTFGVEGVICPTTAPSSSTSPSLSPSLVTCFGTEKRFDLKLTSDRYPDETYWNLRNVCTGETVLQGGSNSVAECIDNEAEYVFTIYDTFGDGLCCGGLYEVLYDDVLVHSGDSFGFEESVTFGGGGGCPSPSPSVSSPPTTFCPSGEDIIHLKLKTDKYPGDTSWKLIEIDVGPNATTISSSGYRKYTLEDHVYDETTCVASRNESCYELALYDSYGDGNCCSNGQGYVEIFYESSANSMEFFTKVTNFTTDRLLTTFGPGCNTMNMTEATKTGSFSSRNLFHKMMDYYYPPNEDEVLDWQK